MPGPSRLPAGAENELGQPSPSAPCPVVLLKDTDPAIKSTALSKSLVTNCSLNHDHDREWGAICQRENGRTGRCALALGKVSRAVEFKERNQRKFLTQAMKGIKCREKRVVCREVNGKSTESEFKG